MTKQPARSESSENAVAPSFGPEQSQPQKEPSSSQQLAASAQRLHIPPILLEGDEASETPIPGPGEKFAVGPEVQPASPLSQSAELPERYGTGELLVLARDPHTLYAHWDLASEQQRDYNSQSADRHLILRVQ